QEAALCRPYGSEIPLSIAVQQQPIARAHPSDFRLDAIEVPRQQQVGLPVPFEVVRQDAVNGGELRLERQRHERERAVAVVPPQGGRERVRLLQDRTGQLRRREDI